MQVNDPVVAYIAIDNLEAHFVCGQLNDAGVHAAVVEDISVVGGWIGGWASQLHKPQVCVAKADAERAAEVIQEYERRRSERRAADAIKTKAGTVETVEVTCEDCGERSAYPVAQRGSVQNCPRCHGYVDVLDDDDGDVLGEEAESLDDQDDADADAELNSDSDSDDNVEADGDRQTR